MDLGGLNIRRNTQSCGKAADFDLVVAEDQRLLVSNDRERVRLELVEEQVAGLESKFPEDVDEPGSPVKEIILRHLSWLVDSYWCA
jgi:hypothetical protein